MSKRVNPQWLVNRFPKDLKAQIRYLVGKRYQVIHQENESAQLLKKKTFSCLFCLITGIIPYGIWYMAKRDNAVYLDMSDQSPTPLGKRNITIEKFQELYDRLGIIGIFIWLIAGLLLFALIFGATSRYSPYIHTYKEVPGPAFTNWRTPVPPTRRF